jgi:alanyl-tRNA synthetase
MRKETKRLYFEDPYQVEFEAQVSRKIIHEQKPALILDQSCFYPESGGQPCDKGQIDGINVLKVVEDKEEVLHLVEKDVSSKKIKGKIDWERRFDHMQQHSGQHILSQSFYEFFEAETLSFHLGFQKRRLKESRSGQTTLFFRIGR